MFGFGKKKDEIKTSAIKKHLRVMLACGSGVCTSSLVVPMVEEILDNEGYNYEIIKGSIFQIKDHPNLDICLTTFTQIPKDVEELGIPVVSFAPLFKGDKETVLRNIKRGLEGGEKGMIE